MIDDRELPNLWYEFPLDEDDLTAYLEFGPWKMMNLQSAEYFNSVIEKFVPSVINSPYFKNVDSSRRGGKQVKLDGLAAKYAIVDEVSYWQKRGPLDLVRLKNDPEYSEFIRDLIILELDVKDYIWGELGREVDKQLLWGNGSWSPKGIL